MVVELWIHLVSHRCWCVVLCLFPLKASGGVDDFPPIVRNAGRQPWLQPSVSSAQSSDSTLPVSLAVTKCYFFILLFRGRLHLL